MRMNSTHYSRATVALLCVVGLVAVAGTAGAFSVSTEGDIPNETAVGSEVSVTYVIDDPYDGPPNEYTLQGETELENVSWTVEVLDQGDGVDQETYGEQSFSQPMDRDGAQNGDEVRITLEGTVPAVGNYTYEPRENYTVAEFARVTGSNENEFRNDSAHHYTEDSREARQAIDDAGTAIEDAGGNSEAENLRGNAISAYENGNFENAVDLANQAQNTAEQAQQSQQTTQTLLLAAGAVVLLLLLGGGGYYFYSQSQEDDYSKL
jgi:exonuclease VII small subunit